jgi:glycosyltransferase involved in cell wall biosynthesis
VSKERVLYLCGHAPWQRNGGAMLRNYWMIDALTKKYAVDLVVAGEPGPIPSDFAALVDDYACFPRSAAGRSGLRRIARAATPGESTLTAGWTNTALREYVAERLGRHAYAAIHLDLPMIGALPRRNAIPIVYNAHNCESALLSRRAGTERAPLAALLALEALRVRGQERDLIERASLVAVCSENDLADLERFAPGVRAKAAIVTSEPLTVLITGSMDWRPNVLGLRWFLRNGVAQLSARVPNVTVRIAGRMDRALVAEVEGFANVEAVPNPESMEPHLMAATVVAAPIVASSGTRLRILEAWAAGRPVVTTTAGAFGLDAKPGRDLLVCDEPLGFADAIVTLLEAPQKRAELVANAGALVKRYDWPGIATELLGAYERLGLESPQRRVPVLSEELYALAATS